MGILKPSSFNKIFKRELNRKGILKIFGSSLIFFFFATGIAAPDTEKNNIPANTKINRNVVSEKQINKKITTTTPEVNNELNEIVEEEIDENIDQETELIKQAVAEEETKIETEPIQNTTNQDEVQNESIWYSVVSVVDGDTIKVNMNGTTETLRLIGIDTPESVHPTKPVECFGIEASNRAKELLNGKRVKLEADPSQGERDKYGRLLFYVIMEDGTNFNKKMISDGYAYEYTYNTPYKYQAEFKQAQINAETNKRGLWADGACVEEKVEEITQEEQPQDTQTVQTQPDGHKWYVSSYRTASQYYCDTDDGWRSLSEKYLEVYNSEAELLSHYPGYTLHEPCK